MASQEQPKPDFVDDEVRRYLESQSADVPSESVQRLKHRIQGTMEKSLPGGVNSSTPATSAFRRRWLIRGLAAMAVAAVVFAAFLAGRFETSAYADASRLMDAALETLSQPVERVYLVQVEPGERGVLDFSLPGEVRVTTQGDRFWVEMNRGDRQWVWGRAADDSVWIVAAGGRGMRVEKDEVGPVLAHICDLYSVQLETLLRTSLSDFVLTHDASSPTIHRITAVPGPKAVSGIHRATIDIDKETKAIRHLVIERTRPERWASTVTLTLVDSRTPDEALYSPEGHSRKSDSVLSRTRNPERRRELIQGWFKTPVERWILPAKEKSSSGSPNE